MDAGRRKGGAMGGGSSTINEAATSPPCNSRWSDLPPELAGLVLDRLPSNADRIRFSSVCRRYWRHGARQWSSSAPALPPWINFMDSKRTFQSFRSGNLHTRMAPKNRTWLGSSDNWLLFLTPWKFLKLQNPLTGAALTLPAIYHSVEHEQSRRGFFGRVSITSFIVCSSSNLVIANVEIDDGPAIACCRPGCPSWSARPYDAGGELHWRYRYQGITFRHGKVYGLNSNGELFLHDVIASAAADDEYSSPPTTVSPGRKLIDGIFYQAKLYLVAMTTSCTGGGHGKLLIVRRTTTQRLSFRLRVFEADLETCRWKKMERLEEDDDDVLFVSEKFSKVVSADRHGGYGLRRNHIYFLDHAYYPRRTIRCCMYDLSNDTFSLAVPSVHMPDEELKATWFFPRA